MIALLSPTAAAPELGPDVECVRVNSGYEAAAELLAAPAEALLVDLGRITPPHVPLLALAVDLAVPVVAFGAVSADLKGEVLANTQLVSPDRVGDVLAGIVRPAPAAAEKEEAAEAAPTDKAAASAPAERTPAEAPKPTGTLTQAELDALLGES